MVGSKTLHVSRSRLNGGLFCNLADLHAHIAPSIPPSVYWHIAQSEGYKLSKRDYHDFVNLLVLSPEKKTTLRTYLDKVYHPILDKLSSGSIALEKCTYETMSGAYRANNITLLELRGNPMKHNKEGEVDLDHAIMAILRGMERALLEYPKLRAGIIFCLDRQFSVVKNSIIIEKAIKYHNRGVIGLDFSNYDTGTFHFKDYTKLVEKARRAGLKITAHSGETDDTNDMWECIEYIKPDRIGHGIKAAYDKKLMRVLHDNNIVLEVCPLSNLMTKAIKDNKELKYILQTLFKNKVKITINTDWPEMIKNAHLIDQYSYLQSNNILTKSQIRQTIEWSFQNTFINLGNKHENLYL
ncbi:MAG: adenosine deaminase [Patescibacteria group bacterium]